jgi:hypothetical protein
MAAIQIGGITMFSFRPARRVATFAVIAGVLAVAAPAGASSANLHSGPRAIVTDNKDPDSLVFSGDAYDNEMGVTGAGADAGLVLMADMGGQFSRTRPSADGIIAVLIGL